MKVAIKEIRAHDMYVYTIHTMDFCTKVKTHSLMTWGFTQAINFPEQWNPFKKFMEAIKAIK